MAKPVSGRVGRAVPEVVSDDARVLQLYREAERAAVLGLLANLALGLLKVVAGSVGSSFALVSDAVNSLGDVFASAVVLFALRVARRPPDEEHPYGHTRAEAIAGSNVAVLIALSAALVGWHAIRQLGAPHDVPPAWTLWIAAVNVPLKEGLYRYKVRVGNRTGSSALIANAWDHRSDALSALAVLIGLSAVRWGGSAWAGADSGAALVVAAAIAFSSVQLFRKSASELMDPQAEADLVQRVERCAQAVGDVEAVEKLWVRKSGLEHFVDIHIQVDETLTVAEGHRIGHRVKERLLADFPSLRDVLVHLEPRR